MRGYRNIIQSVTTDCQKNSSYGGYLMKSLHHIHNRSSFSCEERIANNRELNLMWGQIFIN